jgi:hypothetical protein
MKTQGAGAMSDMGILLVCVAAVVIVFIVANAWLDSRLK